MVKASLTAFSLLSDDVMLNIFMKLDGDPRDWARIACVSTRFSALINDSCYRLKCFQRIPALVSDLVSSLPSQILSLGSWSALHKLSTCCPGLIHAGVLLDNSDFGLERDIGGNEDYRHSSVEMCPEIVLKNQCTSSHVSFGRAWDLSSEQGNKLLPRRLREDSLYICNWPGCIHQEEKRKYMVFRGFFKDFKKSSVWRTITDGRRNKIDLGCAFCSCLQTWDLHSAFCLRRVFGFHDDGEPVVRAFVCENGHVSGAWTEQ